MKFSVASCTGLPLPSYPLPKLLSTERLCIVGKNTRFITKEGHVQIALPKSCSRSRVVMHSGRLNSSEKLRHGFDEPEPFRGKSGSVSFGGLTHQSVEESNLVSAPFKEESGSLLWVLAPATFISSFVLHFMVIDAIEDVFKNKVFAEILSSFSTEVLFYAGLGVFLFVTNHVQKPYLQFSSKRWSLITGLRGYLSFSFIIMGFKVLAPLIVMYVTWPELGPTALVSVAPFLTGCLVQFLIEKLLDRNRSSCWPILPIIFEVYRTYQLSRATNFIEKLIFAMNENASGSIMAVPPAEIASRAGALLSLVATFRVLILFCLWSLLMFLLRLFPSRPVAENY